jgi:hypothetical protein
MSATATRVAAPAAAESKMAEAWRLYELGFRSAAAVTARMAIEFAIDDRLKAAGVECDRAPIKDRGRALQNTTGISSAKKKAIVDAFFDLSQFVHGRNRDEHSVHRLMRRADGVLAVISSC